MLRDLNKIARNNNTERDILDDFTGHNTGRSEWIIPGAGETDLINVRGKDTNARVMTVCLETPVPRQLNSSGLISPVAHVTWGVGGTTAEVWIDFGRGVQFSLAASSVRVSAINEAPPAPTGQDVKCGAFLSYLTVGRFSRLQRSFTRDLNWVVGVPINFVQLTIPPFATDLQVTTSRETVNLAVEVMRIDNTILSKHIVLPVGTGLAVSGGPNPIPLIPLPNDAASVVIINNSAGVNTRVSAIFTLGI